MNNILHINSYYITNSLYKNLYDKEEECGLNIKVYIPHSSKYKGLNESFGTYSTLSMDFNELDRAFFLRKHRKISNNIQKTYDIKKFDLIHAHSLFSNGYVAYKMFQKYGIPYIVAVRNTDINIFFKKMVHLRHIGEKIIKNASKVIFISAPYKDIVAQKYLKNIDIDAEKNFDVIPNGINDFWLNNIHCKKNADVRNNIRILCVGDLDQNKNHISTLKACEVLHDRGFDVTFNIVGRILNEKIYNELIASKFVNYLGTMKKEQLINVYRGNDIFVMPSYTETFGLAYAEAMSQGMPVIYTKGQGFDKQFEEGMVGYHVEADNVKMIVENIIKIIENYNYISEQCINKVKKFNWKDIASQYYDIYKRVMQV